MATGPEEQYRLERERRLPRAVENGHVDSHDAERIEEYLDAIDPDKFAVQPPSDMDTTAVSSRRSYAKNLRLVAKAADTRLVDADAESLNAVMQEMQRELSASTVQQRQTALRNFYRYHDDLEVDPELIYMVKNEDSRVDARDPFQREEVDAIREQFDNNRDRAMFDLMLYTGQRDRAVRTLKVGDIDQANDRFHLNTDAAGLKGAKGMRPLLVAKDSVYSWLDDHPAGDDPDAYLITKLPDAARGDPYSPVDNSTVSRRIKEAAREAGIERADERGHPHNLRHSFVRWAYIDLDMDVQTIKYMGGWASNSTTFEETYFNILDEEHAAKAESAAGVREEPPGSDLTPASCPVCDNILEAGAKACPACGTVLTPDAKAAQDEIRAGIDEEKESVDDLDSYKLLDRLENLADENPELVNALLNEDE